MWREKIAISSRQVAVMGPVLGAKTKVSSLLVSLVRLSL